MKTTTNINRIDIIALIAVIILFAFMIPSKAETGRNIHAGLTEVQIASMQLARFNIEIENAVEFTAPVVSESFEVMAAESRLEELSGSFAQDAAYFSPVLQDNFETVTAIESQDNFIAEMEREIRYTVSPIAE